MKPCRYFQNGSCYYGSRCQFAHTVTDKDGLFRKENIVSVNKTCVTCNFLFTGSPEHKQCKSCHHSGSQRDSDSMINKDGLFRKENIVSINKTCITCKFLFTGPPEHKQCKSCHHSGFRKDRNQVTVNERSINYNSRRCLECKETLQKVERSLQYCSKCLYVDCKYVVPNAGSIERGIKLCEECKVKFCLCSHCKEYFQKNGSSKYCLKCMYTDCKYCGFDNPKKIERDKKMCEGCKVKYCPDHNSLGYRRRNQT